MTQEEFFKRTGVRVAADEFSAINTVYNACDVNKDQFCEIWCKMNYMRVGRAKAENASREELEKMYRKFWDLELKTEGSNSMVQNKLTKRDISAIEELGLKVNPEWSMWTLKGNLSVKRGELERKLKE